MTSCISESLAKLPVSRGFVDLFCGAGGISIGLARAGLRRLCGADFNKNSRLTNESAYPSVPFVFGDLSKAAVQREVLEIVGDQRPMILVVAPPVRGSPFLERDALLTRKTTILERTLGMALSSLSLIWRRSSCRDGVIMENVPGTLHLDDGWASSSEVEEELCAAGLKTWNIVFSMRPITVCPSNANAY